MMEKLLTLLVILFVCVAVNAQGLASNQKPAVGQTFDEIVVSSDLNVRRKSQENREGKKLLTNAPGKLNPRTSRLISISDGSEIRPVSGKENRARRSPRSAKKATGSRQEKKFYFQFPKL